MYQPLIKAIRTLIIIIVLTVIILPAKPCLAAGIASPDTMTINSIEAYQDTELNQYYIVTFTLDYTTTPNGSATTNFLFRFKDNLIEIAATAPYDFYNDGYSDGVVCFQFQYDDAVLPTWGENDITIELLGNPSLTWADGDPPNVTNNVIDSWNDTMLLFPARIRVIAQQLENTYSIDMIESQAGVLKLTAYGELYFETVITNLRTIAPTLFSNILASPVFTTENFTLQRKTQLEDKLVGTVFDVGDSADDFGISRMWLSALIWFGVSCFIIYLYASKVGTIGLNFLISMCLIVGSVSGFMPTEIAIAVGILGGLLTFYPIFFRGSSA